MKKLVLVLLVMAFIIPATGMAKKKDKDLMGLYTVTGFNPGVSTSGEPSYTGVLEITQSGGAYMLDWKIGEKQTYKGVGVYTNGVLSVGFNGGVVSYRIEKKNLKGVWAPATGGKVGFEIAERQ